MECPAEAEESYEAYASPEVGELTAVDGSHAANPSDAPGKPAEPRVPATREAIEPAGSGRPAH